VSALLPATARAGGRCAEDVCLELALPPHVAEVRQDATLEFLVLLPAPAAAPQRVKVVLRREDGPRECHARYETVQPGSSWKRAMFRLAGNGESRVAPGVYSAGVARVTGASAAPNDPCATEGAVRFLARKIRVTP